MFFKLLYEPRMLANMTADVFTVYRVLFLVVFLVVTIAAPRPPNIYCTV